MTDTAKILPKLRFPEFENDGEWKVVKLEDIAKRITLKNKDKKSLPVLTNSASGGIVKQEDYFDREIVSKDNLINYYIVSDDDFVYNPRISTIAPVGPISRNKIGEGVMSPLYTVFRFVEGDVDFFEHYFKTNNWHQYLKDKANFGARFDRMNITTEDFISLPIPFPSLPEQQKITAFLTSLDELISAHTKKLEALKAHKKGLMQQLFPAIGEKTPKLRFPEFKNDGEWNFANGDILFKPIVNKQHNSDLPVLAITQEQGAVPREMIDYNVIVSDKSIENYKIVEIGDFIISLRSFQGGIEYSHYKGLCSSAYIVLRRTNDTICNEFYRHYFKSHQYIQDLNRNLEGIRDGKMVSYKQFSEIKIPHPSLPEQQKIVSFLSSIDETIQAQDDKIRKLKTYKNGLMQQMFAK